MFDNKLEEFEFESFFKKHHGSDKASLYIRECRRQSRLILALFPRLSPQSSKHSPALQFLSSRASDIMLEYLSDRDTKKLRYCACRHMQIRCRRRAIQYLIARATSSFGRGIRAGRRYQLRKRKAEHRSTIKIRGARTSCLSD